MVTATATVEFAGVERQNTEALDDLTLGKLGIYVYVLQDPDTRRFFYVGKGGGKNPDGSNSRVLDHFDEAERWLRAIPRGPLSRKVRTILATWENDEEVPWYIVRRNLTEDEAHHVEAALIDALPLTSNGDTDNDQAGHRGREHGLLDKAGVLALNAPPVNPSKVYPHVLAFPIQRALDTDRAPYDAVRSYWPASKDIRMLSPNCLAVGLAEGISRVVVCITKWTPAPTVADRWEFDGQVLDGHELLSKNFSSVLAPAMGYWQRGGYLGVNFDGKGGFTFFRGSSDQKSKYPC